MASSERLQVILNHLQTHLHPKVKPTSTTEPKYFYTLDNNLLSDEQRAFYEENGYLLIPKLIDDEVLDECKQHFIDICNGKFPKGNITMMKDKSLLKTSVKGEYLIYKLQDILWDDVFFKYISDPRILDYVECFTGPNITAVHSMLINKPPDSGKLTSIHPIHQDLHYFPFRPAERIVASWTAMEKVTVANGCLFVVPGTHKSSLQPHCYPKNDVNLAYHGIDGFELVPRLNLEMEKGDTVFFHPLLFHGSGPNLTKGFRKAISCHYAGNDCYYIDVKGTTQEIIAKEVEKIVHRKGMGIITYKEAWLYRQRIIKGPPGVLSKYE